MGSAGGARRRGRAGWLREWPTFVALAGCYGLWALGICAVVGLGVVGLGIVGWVAVAIAVAFHSSLQHEVLHGHPTRWAALNEALVFPALGLFIPYRRFRALHLRHHNDERLTDPYDDPESFYVRICDWRQSRGLLSWLLLANGTFAGRMLVGPWLAMAGFWWSEAQALRQGAPGVRGAWLRHVLGGVPVVAVLIWAGVEIWIYALLAAWPGLSLVMIRSYIEHRAAEDPAHRSVVVDAHWFWRLLFLNNNFHAVHHAHPAVPWYRVPSLWAQDRNAALQANGGYYYRGYGGIMRRWLLTRREPVVHPFVGHDEEAAP